MGPTLGAGDVRVVVDRKQHQSLVGKIEGQDDVGEESGIGVVGDEIGDGRRDEEDVVGEGTGRGEVGEEEVDEAIVEVVGPAQDGEVGPDQG